MELDNFLIKSKEFEESLIIGDKKNKGVYYTDVFLAKKIIAFLKIPYKAIIMDPCCGVGSFIFAAKQNGYENIYGADIDSNAISFCKKENKINNIKKIDTLANSGLYILNKIKLNNPVDYLIGNPPYVPIAKDVFINSSDCLFLKKVKDSGNNLFVAAMYRAFELVKKEGIISYIIPKNFLHIASYKALRNLILKEKRICSIIDLGSCFKQVRGEQIVITIENQYVENNIIEIYKYKNKKIIKQLEISQSYYEDEIILFDSIVDFNIYKKMESTYKKFSDICTGYVGRGKSKSENAISGKDIRKFSFKNILVPEIGNRIFIQNIYSAESGIIASFAGDLEASETVTVFTDGNENMCRFILGFLHSRLCNYFLLNFCYNNSKLTMHTDEKYLKKLPLIINDETFNKIVDIVKVLEKIEYMSNDWFEIMESLNSLIYNTYKISEIEREFIDLKMKKVQSQKWNYDKRK